MNCVVYKSAGKPDTYLYLACQCDFQDLPGELQRTFGTPVKVMELELSQKKEKAKEHASPVMRELEQKGYFLQLPPKISTEEEISKRFS